ncbi:PI-PLC X domain-containing protein At5g67130 [Selaginella moellendorffii]|uniref:PI-PLC X domain-containing protein At5g67130 n=1 Tax=Selaginella moellendorffii TaxID=88036 RepID=UPI000D1C5535|nr:PI-PLC X domain-containing protein At5g67130 [Selaginella moellendorffii]|eukprot:XP_002984037.2 PI-PLC X domain-containing protein At5g67130 [Selaginella moellendorffii]
MDRGSALVTFFPLLLSFALFGGIQACDNGQCKIAESCSQTSDCMPGLACSNLCTNATRCLRTQSFNVLGLNNSMPFNKYSWLTTHNSFSIKGSPSLTGTPILTFDNQEDSVTQQLQNGVRGLMLDMYDFMNDIWLCHSFQGQCQNFTAFQPAINTLREIETFMSQNPSEVITIFIEDYVRRSNAVSTLFANAGLRKYWFPVSRMPKDGSDWPSVANMVANNQRLVVFTSISSKESSEGIAYQWRYVVENQYGDGGLQPGQCSKRAESTALDNKGVSLFLENYFPTNPADTQACRDNSRPLSQVISACHNAAGNRWANFLAVDFYKRSTGGGSFQAVDVLNGNILCGCGDVHECQADLARGVCNTTNTPQVAQNSDDGSPDSQQQQPSQPRSFPSTSPPRIAPPMIGLLVLLLCSWSILHDQQ